MTWFVRHVKRYCWVCNKVTKQAISQEKFDDYGRSWRERSCTECGHVHNRWLHVWDTTKTSLREVTANA
jgi:hypothetical protein